MDYQYEDFTLNDMENVLEYWQDVSQDPEFIAKETDLDLNTVIQILHTLQKRGDISGFSKITRRKPNVNEDKILLFEELMDPEMRKALKLDQLTKTHDDKDYFFDEKEINEVYDAHIFEVKAIKAVYQQGLIIIPLEVTVKGKDYDMFMVYSPDENVYYGSSEGEKTVQSLRTALEPNWDLFDEVTEQILNNHIPLDFWEVKNIQN
jgi:hypothetical protein